MKSLSIGSTIQSESPPSRGAWIEIIVWEYTPDAEYSRPPRGGRGLKSLYQLCQMPEHDPSPPLAGGVD